MTAATFTRDGNRITIRPGKGAWAREIEWSGGRPTWTTDVPGGDGMCVRYTLTVKPLPLEADLLPHVLVTLEAHEAGAQHHGDHAVVIVSQWRPVEALIEWPDLLDSSANSIHIAHHWVSLVLRLSAPMDQTAARDLNLCDFDKSIACLACPAIALVGE